MKQRKAAGQQQACGMERLTVRKILEATEGSKATAGLQQEKVDCEENPLTGKEGQ
ncbi:MAG: hypothetical protein NC413_12995 [Muribaculum sp.]|nr:hypothetical protein [Muribaculum sp.]